MTAVPAAVPWIKKLVSFPTISQSSNLELLELIEAEFRTYGFEPSYSYSADRQRANLFVTVPAADGRTTGGLVISGHTDVVPVQGQQWQTDPFTAQIQDGRLYGRGVADMKSFLGVALWLLPQLARLNLTKPLHFAFTYDEEIGCLGAPSMIQDFLSRGIKPDFAIVGEPSGMQPIIAHKGAHRGRVTFRGVAKHGSLAPYGVNALVPAGEFILFLDELAQRWLQEGPYQSGFTPACPTIGAHQVTGGIQYNIVGQDAVVEYDLRTIPTTGTAEVVELLEAKIFKQLLPQLQERAAQAESLSAAEPSSLVRQVSASHELLAQVPALNTPEDHEILALGRQFAGLKASDAAALKVSYGTEAGQYQQAGIASIVCGPGSIAQAHTAQEWIELEQINRCQQFMIKLLDWAQS